MSRTRQVLEFIREYRRKVGYPPTVREIGDALGMKSSNTVHHHLRQLEVAGRITRKPGSPRAITIID